MIVRMVEDDEAWGIYWGGSPVQVLLRGLECGGARLSMSLTDVSEPVMTGLDAVDGCADALCCRLVFDLLFVIFLSVRCLYMTWDLTCRIVFPALN